MGAKFCFFTDPAVLKAQPDSDAFGPMPSSAGKDRFRITHRHPATATGAPAVAICDGMLCVQKAGAGMLTLILKPSQTPPFESPVVSYFIYRGIATSPFETGQPLIDANSAPGSGANPPKIFTDNDPLERLFTYSHDPVQTHLVKSGDLLGAYAGDCALEIVLHRLGYAATLGFARRADTVIEVPTLAADNGGLAWRADDEGCFDHWNNKERVLGFMDPCAYFGAFVQTRLRVGTGPDKGKIKGSKIFEKLLAKAANRDVAWLDIRGNSGSSYNLFGLYSDFVRFAPGGPGLNFRKGSWPLCELKLGDVPGTDKHGLRRTGLCLPVGRSTDPAVLVSKGFATSGKANLAAKAPAMAVDTGAPDVAVPDPVNPGSNVKFYRPIRLAFPIADDNGAEVLAASYTRVNLYERLPSPGPPASPLDIAGGEYLDGLFPLRDLRLDTNFANHGLRFDVFWEEVFVDLSRARGPAYVAAIAIAADVKHVALIVFPTFFFPGATSTEHHAPVSLTARFEPGAGNFEAWLKTTFSHASFTRTTIGAGTLAEADALIVREIGTDGDSKSRALGDIDDYCIVLLDKSNHDSMLSVIGSPGFSTAWPVLSRISASANLTDGQSNANYVKRTLCASSLESDGAGKLTWADAPWSKQIVEYAYP